MNHLQEKKRAYLLASLDLIKIEYRLKNKRIAQQDSEQIISTPPLGDDIAKQCRQKLEESLNAQFRKLCHHWQALNAHSSMIDGRNLDRFKTDSPPLRQLNDEAILLHKELLKSMKVALEIEQTACAMIYFAAILFLIGLSLVIIPAILVIVCTALLVAATLMLGNFTFLTACIHAALIGLPTAVFVGLLSVSIGLLSLIPYGLARLVDHKQGLSNDEIELLLDGNIELQKLIITAPKPSYFENWCLFGKKPTAVALAVTDETTIAVVPL